MIKLKQKYKFINPGSVNHNRIYTVMLTVEAKKIYPIIPSHFKYCLLDSSNNRYRNCTNNLQNILKTSFKFELIEDFSENDKKCIDFLELLVDKQLNSKSHGMDSVLHEILEILKKLILKDFKEKNKIL